MDFKAWNENVIKEFRANGGKVGGPFEGASLLLLSTKGAKTGRTHQTPLVYFQDNGSYVIIASKAGAPDHPQWFNNLVANPQVEVDTGTDTFPARAEVTQGAERQRLYDTMAAKMPNFKEYQEKTTRQIPVVKLTRI